MHVLDHIKEDQKQFLAQFILILSVTTIQRSLVHGGTILYQPMIDIKQNSIGYKVGVGQHLFAYKLP